VIRITITKGLTYGSPPRIWIYPSGAPSDAGQAGSTDLEPCRELSVLLNAILLDNNNASGRSNSGRKRTAL